MTNEAQAHPPASAAGDEDPIAIEHVREAAPFWPYGTDGTYRLIRRGELAAIAIGRRRFVTRRLLRECLARSIRVEPATKSPRAKSHGEATGGDR